MTSNRLPIILLILAIVLVGLYSSIFVVNAREQAIVVRFGQIQSVKTEPGIYFKLPFGFMDADRVQLVEKQALRLDLDNIRVQVQDGQTFDVDAFVIYNISDVRRFRETVSGDREAAEARLRAQLDSSLRRVYGLRDYNAALSEERVAMMLEIRDDLRTDAENLGLHIDDVRIRRTDLSPEVAPNTYNAMRSASPWPRRISASRWAPAVSSTTWRSATARRRWPSSLPSARIRSASARRSERMAL